MDLKQFAETLKENPRRWIQFLAAPTEKIEMILEDPDHGLNSKLFDDLDRAFQKHSFYQQTYKKYQHDILEAVKKQVNHPALPQLQKERDLALKQLNDFKNEISKMSQNLELIEEKNHIETFLFGNCILLFFCFFLASNYFQLLRVKDRGKKTSRRTSKVE